jgi:hypothetical protein
MQPINRVRSISENKCKVNDLLMLPLATCCNQIYVQKNLKATLQFQVWRTQIEDEEMY